MMYFEEALRILFANRIRSLLTMTGLIIGVGAVIAIQVLGSSMAGAVNGALGALTDNSFVVFPNSRQRNVSNAAIRLSDIAAISGSIPGIISAQPLGFRQDIVRSGHQVARFAMSPDGPISFENLAVIYGRHFTNNDVAQATNVCILSSVAYKKLFPSGGDPTGQSIYVGSHRYVVVGVLAPPKKGFLNARFSGDITIPWTTYDHNYVHGGTVFGAGFIVDNPAHIPAIEIAVENKLKELHGNPKGVQYQTGDKASFSKSVGGIFGALTLVVGLIGAVSLLVAGIGVMNIMLVSVAERTREIGIRKAIGARKGQVLMQFFIEALLLCGIGCGIGLVIGLGIGSFINSVFIIKVTGTVVPIPIFEAIVIAAVFAVVVTLAFGTYPAYRAARLDPIEALRYE